MSDQITPRNPPRRRRSWATATATAVAVAALTGGSALAASTSAAAPAAPGTATALASASAAHGVTVLRFAVRFSPFHLVDVPPLGKTPEDVGIGDYVVFSDELLDRDGHVAGTEGGSGLVTKVSTTGAQVFYSLAVQLPHGQLAASGLASPAATKQLAVIGGTGRYVGARGHLDLVENGDGTGRLVITLGA